MKNLFLTLILLAICTVGMAQINLREGIVITLAGDTLHGSIDYRTDPMNSEQCLFIPDGKTNQSFTGLERLPAIVFWTRAAFTSPRKLQTGTLEPAPSFWNM